MKISKAMTPSKKRVIPSIQIYLDKINLDKIIIRKAIESHDTIEEKSYTFYPNLSFNLRS